jgi:hypothetical protein
MRQEKPEQKITDKHKHTQAGMYLTCNAKVNQIQVFCDRQMIPRFRVFQWCGLLVDSAQYSSLLQMRKKKQANRHTERQKDTHTHIQRERVQEFKRSRERNTDNKHTQHISAHRHKRQVYTAMRTNTGVRSRRSELRMFECLPSAVHWDGYHWVHATFSAQFRWQSRAVPLPTGTSRGNRG